MAKSRKRQDDTLSPEYASSGNDPNNLSGHASGNGNGDGHAGGDLGDRVAARAYELYLARGGADGQAWDDWLAAERELSAPPGDSGK